LSCDSSNIVKASKLGRAFKEWRTKVCTRRLCSDDCLVKEMSVRGGVGGVGGWKFRLCCFLVSSCLGIQDTRRPRLASACRSVDDGDADHGDFSQILLNMLPFLVC